MNRDAQKSPPPDAGLTRRDFLQTAGAGLAFSAAALTPAVREPEPGSRLESAFRVRFEQGFIASLKHARDTVDTEYVSPGALLGDVIVRYRTGGGVWQDLGSGEPVRRSVRSGEDGRQQSVLIESAAATPAPLLAIDFTVRDSSIGWRITVRNPGNEPLEIGDLAIPLPINPNRARSGDSASTPPLLKHALIAGDGSFLLWTRANLVGPWLMITPDPGTSLEYWEPQQVYRVFIHSAAAGAVAAGRGCKWRQPNTKLTLPPRQERAYGFTLRWAEDYDHARRILVEQGLIDVHVAPGMTLPADLAARIALRTSERIQGISAEHPAQTTLRRIGRSGDAEIWEVRFARLGENRLTVRFGNDRRMHLEFFSTEPLETLIRKRATFIAAHQHRNPALWYDGLLAEWANDTHVMLGPDNYDRIRGWRIYEVSCDDPGLSKPAFLAAKNAELPVQAEVDALDYYIANFVWGGLQRTTEETFAHGIYGIPNWRTNRESGDPGRNGRQHLWRIYDYPHITLMYFSLYRVAKHHTHMRTALSAADYLRRAYGTALAMFTVPWEIERWSAYQTGLMNELVIEQVIAALDAEGMHDEAERLRPHWERKVRTFVNERPDLFRSEYAFDTTGFEATHALAKYALRHADPDPPAARDTRAGAGAAPASSRILLESARRFMENQIAANVFCRGSLETAYYLLGSDIRGSGGNSYTLTYMSQMGGWSVLDYALHHAAEPSPWLRLGYASFLSAWALMNSGTPASNYGYWFPGPQSDGAAGGGFEPAPWGQTWLEQPHARGSWYYSCEIDLGFCGAMRCARTVLADDPIFGRFGFGGEVRRTGPSLEIVPRDGVRRRFHARLDGRRLDLETSVDRFAREQPITLREDLSAIRFQLQSENPAAHTNTVQLGGLPAGTYRVVMDGQPVTSIELAEGGSASFDVPFNGRAGATVEITRIP
jgi:hypothetical protein